MAFLHQILERKNQELAAAQNLRSLNDLKAMLRDAPGARPFAAALRQQFGLIAEIKRRSPSAGEMRAANVEEAPGAYARSAAVKAVSVLTNTADFGMGVEELTRIKGLVNKPVLRKDFIFDDYQVYEARAYGADAVLLMANVLDREKMRRLFDLTRELGMEVLFEAHTREEIDMIPSGATLYGINSRKFMASNRWYLAKLFSKLGGSKDGAGKDFSVELDTFELIRYLPTEAVKIAESGLKPSKLLDVINLGYDAVLVGTSLLKAPEGVASMLGQFEQALKFSKMPQSATAARS